MNFNSKIYLPVGVGYSVINSFIREACRLAWQMASLPNPLDLSAGSDADVFDESRYIWHIADLFFVVAILIPLTYWLQIQAQLWQWIHGPIGQLSYLAMFDTRWPSGCQRRGVYKTRPSFGKWQLAHWYMTSNFHFVSIPFDFEFEALVNQKKKLVWPIIQSNRPIFFNVLHAIQISLLNPCYVLWPKNKQNEEMLINSA